MGSDDAFNTLNWTYGASQHAFIAVEGASRCRVWRERAGTWSALVIHAATATQEAFPTAERAMTWCEQRVAERKPKPVTTTPHRG